MVDKSNPSMSAVYRAKTEPIHDLSDTRIVEIMAKTYIPASDTGYEDPLFQQAVSMSRGEESKTDKLYQELRRTRDALEIIERNTPDLDLAQALVKSFINFEISRIEAISNPSGGSIPSEE